MELCRTCMNERGNDVVGDEFFSIFDVLDDNNVYIAECLSQWLGYSIEKHDGLPSDVCLPCLDAMKSVSYFIQNAKDCDQKLKLMMGVVTSTFDVEFECSSGSLKLEEISVDKLDNTESQNTDEEVDIKYLPNTYEGAAEQFSDEEIIADIKNDDSGSEESGPSKKPKRTKIETKRFVHKSKLAAQTDDEELDEKELETYTVTEIEDKVICCGCLQLFDSKEELELHGISVHQETRKLKSKNNPHKTVECKCCYKRFKRKVQCQNHRNTFDVLKKVYECTKCNKRIINPKIRRRHAHNHPEWTVALPHFLPVPMTRLEKYGYLCCVQGCVTATNSEDELFEHIKKDHRLIEKRIELFKTDKSFQCVFCFKSFDTKIKLDNHHINKYNTATYQCHQCGKICRSAEFLRAHENRHADVKPYECDICLKSYYSAAVLKQHKLSHTQPKSLICSICGMAFRTKPFLENHYRIHSDIKSFQCDVCDKTFKHSSSLFAHKKTHDPGKHVKCTECGKGFADTTNLKRHMISHTGIKPYPCNHCEKRFMRLGERSEHENVVHFGIMPYECDTCGAGFTTKRTFQKHESVCRT